LDAFEKIAEDRIRQALEEGVFDNLKNMGKPIEFEDETWVPEDLRLAYRMLKNAGFTPPEIELRNEIINLKELMSLVDDETQRAKHLREIEGKLLRLNLMRKKPFNLDDFPEYREKIIERLGKE